VKKVLELAQTLSEGVGKGLDILAYHLIPAKAHPVKVSQGIVQEADHLRLSHLHNNCRLSSIIHGLPLVGRTKATTQ